jgi:lysophospholipase L1-like esterase
MTDSPQLAAAAASRRNGRLARLQGWQRTALGLSVSLVVVGSLAGAFELTSYALLQRAGEIPRPLFFRQSLSQPNNFVPEVRAAVPGVKADTLRLSHLDPLLGYAHDPTSYSRFQAHPGFATYGASDDERSQRIVTLGGSTTDPVVSEGNWSKVLADLYRAEGTRSQVLNGGVGGYSSNAELLKLLRDVLGLEPQLVVAFNGINDLGFAHSIPAHPMVSIQQYRLFDALTNGQGGDAPFLPNTVRFLRKILLPPAELGISMGTPYDIADYDQWFRNVRLSHAIAAEYDIRYVCFLQPTLGTGEYKPTQHETDMLAKRGKGYVRTVNLFDEKARLLAAEHSYIVDLTDVLAGQSGMYRDPRHPNDKGNRIIAQAIFSELRRRG